jgi:PAS domain S-box-containing protein
MQMKRLSTKRKFKIGVAAILVLSGATISLAAYHYLKHLATRDIYRETEIFISTADATRTYVKDVLRPKVLPLVEKNRFIPHAMSTSFVGREIMGRLKKRFPEFQYKRAASNPTNPLNQADDFEISMLDWFDKNRDSREWHGLIRKNDLAYYTRMRAIYAESQCLRCHGNPADAPQEMKALYGSNGGFGYKIGQVVAADTVYIPVDFTFVRIKEAAWLVFLIAVVSLFALWGLFSLLFNRTVVSEMNGLLARFRSITGPVEKIQDTEKLNPSDEFEQVKTAFVNVADNLEQTHKELKASEKKYRSLFETSRDAILIFNSDTRLLEINATGLAIFGFKDHNEAMSIETFYQLFWDTRDAERFERTIKEKGFAQGLEMFFVDRNGKKLTVAVSATARTDESGQYAGIDATLRDVTAKRRMEKYLAQTEKLAAIGQLASGMAHEINNPLSVIKCYASLVAKQHPEEDQLGKDIKIIQKHTEQCQSVVNGLLNFSRMPDPQKTRIDIRTGLEDILEVLDHQIKKAGITVERQFNEDTPIVTADGRQMEQVFMNLLLNAIQAMPDGGLLKIEIPHRDPDGMQKVRITDTGIGIADKNIDRIFDPFFTTKTEGEGTGLGLSVSYGIVRRHGGKIELESRVGKGTTFTVCLPVE